MGQGDPVGGSLGLAELVDQHGEVLLPDLKHYFGIDLRDLFAEAPPFSPRYVMAHVRWLPLGSALTAERRGGQTFRGWDADRYMLARAIDILNASLFAFISANSDPKKSKPKPPEPYPLPDHTTREAKRARDARPGSFASVASNLLAKSKKRKEGAVTCPEPATRT